MMTRPLPAPPRRGPLACLALAAALAGAGCGRVPENPPPRCGEGICTIEEGDHLVSVVDATHDEDFVFLDFESAGEVSVKDAAGSMDWDLGFRRARIMSNGGVSGPGGMQVAFVEEDFDAVDAPPAEGWRVDVPGDGFEFEPGGTVFNEAPAWYDYDLLEHTLEAADRTYVARTVEGGLFKVRFRGYYDGDGEPAHISFAWSAIADDALAFE